MRLFFAIKPDSDTIKKMDELRKPLMSCRTPVKWVDRDLMHITLLFLGDLDKTEYKQLLASIDKSRIDVEPFRVHIRGCGSFIKSSIPAVYWYGLEKSDQLEMLYKNLCKAVPASIRSEDNRPFSPHITIGRNRKRFEDEVFTTEMKRVAESSAGEIEVNSFFLIESKLTPSGPVYTTRKEFILS